MGALYQGLIVTGVLSIGAIYWVVHKLVTGPLTVEGKSFDAMSLFWCGITGLAVTAPSWSSPSTTPAPASAR